MVDVKPFGSKAALVTDDPVVARRAKGTGLRVMVEVTRGGTWTIGGKQPLLWLFVGAPGRVWAVAERSEAKKTA
ncbi:MAG: hypothetical protein ACPLPR_01240 [Bacillota bacterium]